MKLFTAEIFTMNLHEFANVFYRCALLELYSTEKEYIDRLEYCIINYKQPIQSANSNAPRPLKSVVSDLFTNIEEIHRFHKE